MTIENQRRRLMETREPSDQAGRHSVWMRGLFMLLFIIGFSMGHWLLNVLAILQFLWLVFAREPNRFIADFGNGLAIWLAEVGRFLTCATEEKPFPWEPWPATHGDAPAP
jgi:hypothetical protein